MAAKKRHPTQVEEDRTRMMKLIRRGATQSQIAEMIGVTRQQVTYDYKMVLTHWKEERDEDTKQIVAAKLEEIAEVKREAWEGYERSKLDAEKEVAEDGARGEKTVKTREGRLPGTEYLNVVLNCIRQERDLLGLDPAKSVNVSGQVVSWDVFLQGIPEGPVPDTVEQDIVKALGEK